MDGPLPITGLILAGGASSRMGRTKALLPFGPERLIERQVRLLRPLCQELLVVTNEPEAFDFLGLPLVQDRTPISEDGASLAPEGIGVRRTPGLGPLAGLEAGLTAATQPVVLGVACDMPFLSEAVIRQLYALLGPSYAAVPRTADGPEPLCALWRRGALPAIRGALVAGQRSPQRLLAQLPVAWLEGEALAALGDPALHFLNCNTPADYDRARQLSEEGAPGGETLRH